MVSDLEYCIEKINQILDFYGCHVASKDGWDEVTVWDASGNHCIDTVLGEIKRPT